MEASNNGERSLGQTLKLPVKEVRQKEGFLGEEATEKYDRMSVSGWQKWIDANIENFKSNIENAALLMKGFAEGINYVQEISKKGIVHDFKDPIIRIIDDNDPDLPNFECFADGRTINIKKAYLEKASTFDMNSMQTVKSRNDKDKVVFLGTMQDMFSLTGVEEGHHASVLQNKKSKAINNNSGVAEYDADDIEYPSLKCRLRYAEEKNMPPATIKVLEERVEKARTVREQLKR